MALTNNKPSCTQIQIVQQNIDFIETHEEIAAIVLLGILVTIFIIQNAHALSMTCPGFVDNEKCLTIDKQSYQFGKQAGLMGFIK